MTNRKNCTSWITLIEQGLCLNWATETYIIHIYVYVCVYICIDAYIHINIYAFSCYRPLFQHSAKLPSIVRCSVTAASITLNQVYPNGVYTSNYFIASRHFENIIKLMPDNHEEVKHSGSLMETTCACPHPELHKSLLEKRRREGKSQLERPCLPAEEGNIQPNQKTAFGVKAVVSPQKSESMSQQQCYGLNFARFFCLNCKNNLKIILQFSKVLLSRFLSLLSQNDGEL